MTASDIRAFATIATNSTSRHESQATPKGLPAITALLGELAAQLAELNSSINVIIAATVCK